MKSTFPKMAIIGLLLFGISPAAQAANCFDLSPRVLQGKSIDKEDGALQPRDLSRDEQRLLQNFFKALRGRWEGTVHDLTCRGKETAPDPQSDTYELEFKSHPQGHIGVVFKFDMYSEDLRKGFQDELHMHVQVARLVVDKLTSDIEIVKITADEIAFIEKRLIRNSAGGISQVREVHRTMKRSDKTFELETLHYWQGRMIGSQIWRANKKF